LHPAVETTPPDLAERSRTCRRQSASEQAAKLDGLGQLCRSRRWPFDIDAITNSSSQLDCRIIHSVERFGGPVMKLGARAHLICCLAWLLCAAFATRAAAQDESVHARITRALEASSELTEVAREEQPNWLWTEHQLFDEQYPLTVDIVAGKDSTPTKVIYFFPGGGTNFHASFFTPHSDNIAHYFREHGYVIVGITPREDNVPAEVKDTRFARGWGMTKHRADVRHVIEAVQRELELPYEVLGHSYGASLALDYGATFSDELARLIILDIYAFDPRTEGQSIRLAQRTYSAYDQLLVLGTYLEAMGASVGNLATWSDAERVADSGFARALVSDRRGNFTNEGLYYYSMIETSAMPGLHSLFSGLKFDWPVHASYLAGTYTLQDNPRDDTFELIHVDKARLKESAAAAGSGLVPAAYSRDYWAAVAGNNTYQIAWANIQCPFLWVNTELGYAAQQYGALAAREAGNTSVEAQVVKGYAHADILLGHNARTEVWPLLVQ
jgi:pimeloyl-ACP methyl ester carboxylesterase